MNEKRVPLLCKIKKHITIPSPSASIYCEYGFRYRTEKLCKNCPKKVKTEFNWGI